jgi:hypothetical protein
MSAKNIYRFYVYAYLREDGSPYYIGKGSKKRAWSSSHNINLPKNKKNIIILEENLSNVGALALERFYIRWYGRKDLGTGILRNMTDGGEDCGIFQNLCNSPTIRKKMSKSMINYWKNFENREKQSKRIKKYFDSDTNRKKHSDIMKTYYENHNVKKKTENTKKKMSDASKKRWLNPEYKKKIINAAKNRWENQEFKNKVSKKIKESMKKYYQSVPSE